MIRISRGCGIGAALATLLLVNGCAVEAAAPDQRLVIACQAADEDVVSLTVLAEYSTDISQSLVEMPATLWLCDPDDPLVSQRLTCHPEQTERIAAGIEALTNEPADIGDRVLCGAGNPRWLPDAG